MRSPPRPGSRGVRWARRWHGRAGAWSRRTKREKRVNMSHVDDGTLHAYLDGELSPPETQTVETHVVQCPACRTRLEEERALIARAAELLARAAPPERELPAFRPGHAKPPVRFWWQVRLPLAWAATVALALGIGTYLGERSGTRLARTVERPADLANRITQNVPALDSLAVAERQKVSERRARPSARSVTPAPAPSMVEGERKERRAEPPAAAIRIRGANRLNAGEVAPGFGDGGVVAKAAAPAPSRPEMVSLGDRGYALKDAPIGVDSARLLLGRDPLAVPDLPIRGIYRARMIGYSGLVIVEQALDSTNVIEVINGRASSLALDAVVVTAAGEERRDARNRPDSAAPAPPPPPPPPEPAPAAAVEQARRDALAFFVDVRGPVSADSLAALRRALRPLRP
ncbi:MAG: hypothetical protein DMD33_03980 [Gemmatimonadetes bacterium]|nr:MAG: hypothetical protein DMD33_03980 [Gemmatimonadota bacterium]